MLERTGGTVFALVSIPSRLSDACKIAESISSHKRYICVLVLINTVE